MIAVLMLAADISCNTEGRSADPTGCRANAPNPEHEVQRSSRESQVAFVDADPLRACYLRTMATERSIIERAFELAQSGQMNTAEELSRQLVKEGYEAVHLHLAGRSVLRKQLLAMCRRGSNSTKTERSASA